jgi:hypothetical protein
MERNAVLNLRIPAGLKRALRTASFEDARTMSGMVARILRTWLTQEGYLAGVPRPGKRHSRR